MSSEVENGYTFRMGDHEITMRDSFSSMLESTQLTDCLLVCHTHLKDGPTGGTAAADANASTNGLTNGHSSPSPTPANSRSTPEAAKSDQILRTHRVILSASSEYFRSIFSTVPNTLNNGVVAVIITNVDFEDLEAIIDFIYKGQVSVGQSRIQKFLSAAQLLMVKGLMNIKLVNNDDQPIDDKTYAENELIQKLKQEKRLLEQQVKAIKETERSKSDKLRHEVELEIKKKFEIEKSVLSEEKQRFEAEKMKFTIEKEVFEKNKAKESANKLNNVNSVTPIAPKVVKNSNNSILIETLTQNSEQNPKTIQNESINTRSLRGTPVKTASATVVSNTSSPAKGSSLLEAPTLEPEGRQLRKRIKLSDTTDGSHETTNENLPKDEVQQMDVEEEDGEVYEVDFSQTSDAQTTEQQTEDIKPEEKSSGAVPEKIELTPTPQTSTILASALTYHTKVTPIQTSAPSQVNTRSARRSTSSIGSASTQSISGENGGDGDSSRRKVPTRSNSYVKDETMETLEAESTPRTRQRSALETPVTGVTKPPGSLVFTCPYCPQTYHGENAMQDHINGVHLSQKTQYICDYCGKVYTWRISLNKHLRTVHPNEPIPDA